MADNPADEIYATDPDVAFAPQEERLVPGRLAELGGFIECLEAWGTDSPDEAADAIRQFLTDPECGIEHLREDAPLDAS